MNRSFLYHIVTPAEWERALQLKKYRPAKAKADGFIHASWEEQILKSAGRHFTDFDSLIVLVIPVSRVRKILKEEKSESGESFPHLYGWFELDDVTDVKLLSRTGRGELEMD